MKWIKQDADIHEYIDAFIKASNLCFDIKAPLYSTKHKQLSHKRNRKLTRQLRRKSSL